MQLQKDVTVTYRFSEIEDEFASAKSRSELLAAASTREKLFRRLDSLMVPNGVLSLDIFDTLLLRDNSSELTRFLEIGELIAKILNGEALEKLQFKRRGAAPTERGVDAFLCRYLGTQATYRAREKVKGCREGSLREIHAVASKLLTGADDHEAEFIEAELRYEATRVKPNALIFDYVDLHRKRGGSAILVTDMYMHEDHVKTLLKLAGVDPDIFSFIFSSADLIVSKASGLIFAEIERRMDLPASQFLHVGDSLTGDFAQPKKAGWQALHLPVGAAENRARRADHVKSATMLKDKFSLAVDIAMPA